VAEAGAGDEALRLAQDGADAGGKDNMEFRNERKEVTEMPAGDGTGPMGMGPMTGRAAGFCAGYDFPGYANPVPGRGLGWGFGRGFRGRGWWGGTGGWRGGGRGWRHWYYATGLPGWARFGYAPAWGTPPYAAYGAPYAPTMTREQEIEMLQDQAKYFQDALDDIIKRIEELEQEA
jgi:hypothetical protein